MEPEATAPGGFPRTTRELREALEAAGLRPRKRHGQCFLTDVQAVDAIVRDAEVGPADKVVEVGTGPGLLTHALCEAGAEVVTFELDERIQALARTLRAWPARVRFETGDVLAGKRTLAPTFAAAFDPPAQGAARPVKLVSNLPYAVATPVLLGVLALARPPERIVAMVQLEVAEKLLAPAGSAAYGVPSVQVGLKATGRILRRFGPQVFWPPPRVRSALLELRPRRPAPLRPTEHLPFGRFLTALFSQRRKVLSTALAQALGDLGPAARAARLERLGLSPAARAQELAPERLVELWRG